MSKTSDRAIARLETTGEIASAWKNISAGLGKLNKVIDDLTDPTQEDLFPLDPSEFADPIAQVLAETDVRVKATKKKAPTNSA